MKLGKKQTVDKLLLVLFVLFLVGACIGCAAVHHSDTVFYETTDIGAGNFLESLWCAAQFHVLVCLSALWGGGVILIPLVLLFRGYVFACAAAVVGMEHSTAAWIACGLPAVMQLPSLFLLACVGMRISARLCNQALSRKELLHRLPIGRVLIWSALGIFSCALTDCYLIPTLLEYLIN